MPDVHAASLVHALLGLELGPTSRDASNRLSLDGLTLRSTADGALELAIRRLDAASVRLASGPLVLEVDRLALQQVVVQLRLDAGHPRWTAMKAAQAELFGMRLNGIVAPSRAAAPVLQAAPDLAEAPPSAATAAGQASAGRWCLGPLAGANGAIRARIDDAHLVFDADVTVPIREGRINFNEATVAHVGPDSRMGVSRLGIYVDAPNGRSYLYQFPCAPVAGVEYERRGALLGPWVTDRGKLGLQAFGEGLLRQCGAAPGAGFTGQARGLFARTSLSGEIRLGDGTFGAPGVRADFAGRAEGHNTVRVHSPALGRGLTVEMPALSLRQAALHAGGMQLGAGEATGALTLRLDVDGAQSRFALELANVKIAGLQLQPRGHGSP